MSHLWAVIHTEGPAATLPPPHLKVGIFMQSNLVVHKTEDWIMVGAGECSPAKDHINSVEEIPLFT